MQFFCSSSRSYYLVSATDDQWGMYVSVKFWSCAGMNMWYDAWCDVMWCGHSPCKYKNEIIIIIKINHKKYVLTACFVVLFWLYHSTYCLICVVWVWIWFYYKSDTIKNEIRRYISWNRSGRWWYIISILIPFDGIMSFRDFRRLFWLCFILESNKAFKSYKKSLSISICSSFIFHNWHISFLAKI
jgi:hypothetical protein